MQITNMERIASPFEKELETLINKYNMESNSDTPDFILAEYLFNCLMNYNSTVSKRDKWFGVNMWVNKLK